MWDIINGVHLLILLFVIQLVVVSFEATIESTRVFSKCKLVQQNNRGVNFVFRNNNEHNNITRVVENL